MIKGSFAETAQRHLSAVEAMCMETANESTERLQTLTKEFTPVDTGELRDSVEKLPVVKTGDTYRGVVKSDADHAAPIEYGSAPHSIFPNDAEVLKLHDGTYRAYVLNHPGHHGYHMFRRAGVEFERLEAEAIARKNAKKYLGSK